MDHKVFRGVDQRRNASKLCSSWNCRGFLYPHRNYYINTTGIGPKKTTYKEDITPEIKAAMPPEVYNSLPSRGN